jgi:protein-S-isoprenylcysteine O-methyltransferase Ste14
MKYKPFGIYTFKSVCYFTKRYVITMTAGIVQEEKSGPEGMGGMEDETGSAQKSRIKGIISSFIFTAVIGLLLFVPAGTLDWPMAWILLGIYLVTSVIHILVVSPGLIEERTRRHKDSKTWDRYLVIVLILSGFMIMIATGLDHRFVWTEPLTLPVMVISLVLVILGSALVTWATAANRFFSATIRIQGDRGHTVVSDGPYRYVRHPGYAGWILYYLFLPLMLGSVYALIPAGIAVGLLIVRTYLEDTTLQAELEGYREYAGRVRYRLVPGVW